MSTKPRTGSPFTNDNQLSLFSDLTDTGLADNLDKESIHDQTATLTPLGHQILEHWTRHRPKMVGTLERGNHLQQAIFAAQELTGNLLYELTVVQKMDYHRAWEIATREWAFLPDEEDQPHSSFGPATLDPQQPLPVISA